MNELPSPTRFRRFLAALLSVLIGLGPLATPAYAALTKLADEPLGVKNSSKPNIVLTVDDSTSMLFDFLPDYVVGKYNTRGKLVSDGYCRDATGAMATGCGDLGSAKGNDYTTSKLGDRGKYESPGWISQQFGIPYPAYNASFDPSGPGAGCNVDSTDPTAPRCSGGISPGPAPGIVTYPAGNSIKAGQPYEYWLMWPAVAHNSAFNHIYYNPRLTYDPPVNSDGTSFAPMNALNTTNWTQVPADPWAVSVKYIDLTAPVTVGQWCNSDWTQGVNPDTAAPYAADAAYCRNNGRVAPASSGAPAADGDYTYPWPGPGGIASQDPKYFYARNTSNVSGVTPHPNDNILWCDTTSPAWPQTGALTIPQVCNGYKAAQAGTCVGTAQTCGGTPQTCNGLAAQTCSGSQTQTCTNINRSQTCSGSTTQTCNGPSSQTCVGASSQTCGGYAGQTCNGYQTQTCANIAGQTCNGYQTQSCGSYTTVCTPPPPSSCTTTLGPPGCGGSEGPACTLVTTCPPDTCVTSGKCSVSGATCTAANASSVCGPINGACSASGDQCTTSADCPSQGKCSVSNAACTAGNASTVCTPINGTCSGTGLACTTANAATTCPATGKCTTSNVACTAANAATICTPTSGVCSKTGAACTTANAATNCPASGNCSASGVSCTTANASSDCPTLNGGCSLTGVSCTTANASTNCPTQGQCSVTAANCTAADAAITCPATTGTCSNTGAACTAANVATNCPSTGKCSVTKALCTDATATTACPDQNLKCSVTGNPCATQGTDTAKCPLQGGKCDTTNAACTVDSACDVASTNGTCSIDNSSCQGTGQANCPNVAAASSGATCSTLMNASAKSLLQDANGSGIVCRRNNQAYSGVAASRYNYPSGKYATAITGGLGTPTVWVEDSLPSGAGATGDEAWTWVSSGPASFSGSKAHQSAIGAGEHQHYFSGASTTLAVGVGDTLFTYVYLDPANRPSEVMLQWNDGSWEHRAYWGANAIDWGSDGTDSRRYMGPLPPAGQWVRLAVPASLVGLDGATLNGMAFTLFDGRATWDYSGTARSADTSSASTMDACVPTPSFTTVPRHYWKTEVEWCDKAVLTAGDKWAGYGTGACQAFKDAGHATPRFYQFGADPGTNNYTTPAFQRIDLDIAKKATASYVHTWKDDTGTTQTVTRNFDDEMTNYANWFAYYRTRIQAVKTVTSLAFKELDAQYRVGFHTLSNKPATTFVDIADFTPAQKKTWFTQLFGISIQLNQETPNLNAIVRVGEYYKNGGSAELAGATDPIVLSCQKNWHMLFTDGLTNQDKLPTVAAGNQDKTIPALPEAVLGLTPGNPWPAPFHENPTASSDSASDYITHYWVTDIRTAGPTAPNNVPASDRDPATWQHVNFAAMSLGTEGKLPAGNQSITESQLKAGTLDWPQPYPSVNKPDESGVDDLWHAAINGRGRFVNAQSADELKLGMGQILQDITNQAGSRSGVAFQSVNLSGSNQYIYRVRFEPGWGGSLNKVQIDPVTGNEVAEKWRAADQLTNQLLVVPGIKDMPWFTERRIATRDSTGKPVPFLWANLSASQQDSLAPGKPARGQAILEFLRGNQSREGAKLGQFRVRATPLGDIVNSQAVFVGAPRAPYLDSNDPGYSSFKSSRSGRAAQVYVGANDGMLHAFDDTTGNESWAYVPLGIYRPGPTGLGALSYQEGALPAFKHHYYVDSTPRIVDVDVGGGAWRSVLVAGLGKGGRSYYAIDVTDPSAFSTETDVAKNVMWEFSDPDMGYSYGKPMIAKTRGFGGRWLAILASGYNNASGDGKIFFVDIATGNLLKTMSTGFGSSGSPSGLAHIAGYTRDFRNQLVEQIYSGDLQGNFWRFDVSDPDPNAWVVEKLAYLTDPGGVPQPVTTPPQIEIDVVNGVDRWVFVGTGKLYDESDLADTQIQTLYAIRDGTSTAPAKIATTLSRTDLKEVTTLDGLASRPDTGWYDDLPSGQRIVTPPQAALSVVAYVGTSPQDDPCLTGQPATIYAREFARGNSLITNDAGTVVESMFSAEGGVGLELLGLETPPGQAVPNIVLGVTLGTSGKLKPFTIKAPDFFTAHRMSWRLLAE